MTRGRPMEIVLFTSFCIKVKTNLWPIYKNWMPVSHYLGHSVAQFSNTECLWNFSHFEYVNENLKKNGKLKKT